MLISLPRTTPAAGFFVPVFMVLVLPFPGAQGHGSSLDPHPLRGTKAPGLASLSRFLQPKHKPKHLIWRGFSMSDDENSDIETLSKTDFAKRIGVSKGRVSQYIKAGQMFGDALVMVGEREMVNVPVALAQLSTELDASQRLGNGAGTDLSNPELAAIQSPTRPPTPAEQYQIAKLEAQHIANRRAREEELARQGKYTLTENVTAEANKIAARMMADFEGAIPEMATAIAARFGLSNRDILHEMRAVFTGVRDRLSKELARQAAELPEFVEGEGNGTTGQSPAPLYGGDGEGMGSPAAG